MVRVRMFTFVRNCQTVFQSGCTILCPYKQWKRFSVVSVPNFGHSNRYVGISLHIVLISWWHLPTFKCLGLEWHSLLLTHSPLVRTRHSPERDSRSEKHKGVPGCWGRTKVSATGLKPLGMAFLAPVSQLYLLPWIQVYSGVQAGLEEQSRFCDWERTGTQSPETSLEAKSGVRYARPPGRSDWLGAHIGGRCKSFSLLLYIQIWKYPTIKEMQSKWAQPCLYTALCSQCPGRQLYLKPAVGLPQTPRALHNWRPGTMAAQVWCSL